MTWVNTLYLSDTDGATLISNVNRLMKETNSNTHGTIKPVLISQSHVCFLLPLILDII